uniref:Pesticidal crystal protein Cry1Fb n=1 Tax=Bacillus thuringiensis subsp. morrisoni TaxID=1441 RepID=CR1FB_BACTM|nr:RecName: Full=Pesticidal crystal protein Cry1Fb; AltName: Full=132 kDa crystal protein; AltName: Full=Crystaline entomocidal protoxin; AltName: Full=Insecticidal delta-endotoxin CryIF(b) [Bacillus thuringiensis serovar morrisoni]AAF21767.1 crystal protein Cry1Fb [Bacillus thuringiensis serovar morrisoni]
MKNNIQNQCVPYNCLSNPEVEILSEERSTGRLPLDISLSLTRFLLSEFVPGVGVAFGLFDLIWGFITPSEWSLFLLQIEQLIEQRIETLERNRAITTLRGLADSYEVYLEALREWEENPNNAQLREDVRIRFANTDDALITAINNFTLTSFEIPLLSVYVQAANLHLSLLRDAVSFGQGWGLDIATVNNHYNRLINLIHRYTEHCLDTYNQGLENLRGTNTRQWSRFNQFRRELTLTVLDIVALFPNYDARAYPIQTSSQLTREIYTSSVIEDSPVSANIPNGFNRAEFGVRPPHLMDFMNSLFVTAETVRSQTVWGGHLVSSRNTAGNPINFPIYGVFNPGGAIWIADEDPRPFYRTLSDPVFVRGGFGNPHYVLGLRGVGFQQTGTNHTRTFRNSGTIDSLDEIPPQDNSGAPWNDYSHVLNHVTFVRWPGEIAGSDSWRAPMFSWTHRSADRTNIINPNIITQIPAVKAHNLHSGSTVVRGPGFTGGDLLRRTNTGTFADIRVNITGPLSQRYRVRIRYASTTDLQFFTRINGTSVNQGNFQRTMNRGGNLESGNFRTAGFSTPFSFSNAQSTFTLGTQAFSNQEVYIDRIEFVPAEVTFEAESDLERAQKAVNALFTSTSQLGLKTNVTGYHIDQVSNLVACLSDEFCLDEKRELSEKVKHAKRLSDKRNLLQDPNFRGINRQPDHGWRGSTDITIQGGDDVFKENYVTLPGTFDECYPTYLYQKIDESKLKAYTRYQLRGYIEDSQDLEIYLIRYNSKHEIVNVPGTGSLWPLSVENQIGPCGEPNRCAPHLEWNPDLHCSCRDGEKCVHHSHHFSLDIDVGCTDLNEDLGVWLIFKIKTQDGHARLGNLEFLEEEPLLGEALARVKRAEKKWRDKREKLQLETNIVYKEAKESVDALFVNSQYDRLQADTNIAMIHAADKRVHRIREAYLPELSVIPGVNAAIFEELEGRIFTAYSLYDARNVIKNGNFNNGLLCWNVKGHVDVEEQNNHRSVLVVPEWEAEVSQEVRVCPGRGYILRVTAYKEGYGEGCVTIHEVDNNTDELKFSSNCEKEQVYPGNTVACNDYNKNHGANACSSRNGGYDESYESNSSIPADYAPVYEEEAYTDGQRGNPCEFNRGHTPLPAGYVTAELEYFPETDTVWVEIGETEGTFIVDSVELLLMEE